MPSSHIPGKAQLVTVMVIEDLVKVPPVAQARLIPEMQVVIGFENFMAKII